MGVVQKLTISNKLNKFNLFLFLLILILAISVYGDNLYNISAIGGVNSLDLFRVIPTANAYSDSGITDDSYILQGGAQRVSGQSENFEPFFPRNENAICVYNINSEMSKEICEYYNQTRYIYSEEQTILGNYPYPQEIILLGLDIPDANLSANKEVISFPDYELFIETPIYDWISNNPDKKITHLAIAKDVPIRVGFGDFLDGGCVEVRSLITMLTRNQNKINRYVGSLEHFTTEKYGDVINFVGSHLTGYTLEDVKKMIDKAVMPIENVSELYWVVDKEPQSKGTTFFVIIDPYLNLINMGVPSERIIVDFDLAKPISIDGEVIAYLGPGKYHAGYGLGSWAVQAGNFEFNVSPRAFVNSIESYNGVTFTGDPLNRESIDVGDHGKVADSTSSYAFGGQDYNRSFSGGIGNVAEPKTGGVSKSHNNYVAYYNGLTFAESVFSGWMWLHARHNGGRGVLSGDPLMRLYDEFKLGLGNECVENGDCFSNLCSLDFNGIKRCNLNETVCSFGDSLFIRDLESPLNEVFQPNGSSFCINDSSFYYCNLGSWEVKHVGDSKYVCINITEVHAPFPDKTNHSGVPLRLTEFKYKYNSPCNVDEECSSNVCSEDILGVKRCNVGQFSCVIDDMNIFPTYQRYCTQDYSLFCNLTRWEETTCNPLLVSMDIPINPGQNNIGFPLDLYHEDFVKNVLQLGSSIRLSRFFNGFYNVTDFLYINESSIYRYNDFNLSYGDGFILRHVGLEPTTLKVQGYNYEHFENITIKGKISLLSIPKCVGLSAEEAIQQINNLDESCKTIKKVYEDISLYWSLNETYFDAHSEKSNFIILPYESYFVNCSESTDIEWTPDCNYCIPDVTKVRWSNWEIKSECVDGFANFTRERINLDHNNCQFPSLYETETMTASCDVCENESDRSCKVGKNREYGLENLSIHIENDRKVISIDNIKILNITTDINLDNLKIKINHPDDEIAYIIINNLSLDDSTKRVYLEIKNESSNAVCIRDENNLNDYTEILSTCFSLSCPGSRDQYSCEVINSSTFLVSGLNHSGILEYVCYEELEFTPWSDWINETCSSNNMNQSKFRVEHDVNNCGTFENITHYEYQLVGPLWQNTSWSDWFNVGGCMITNQQNQTKNLTQSDTYGCAENITFHEYQLIECDYCTPARINTTRSNWINETCLISQKNQSRFLTEHDANNCYEITGLESDFSPNITHYEYQLVGPLWQNTSWSDWFNVGGCMITNQQNQTKNLTQSDTYGCAENITFHEYQLIECDYCESNFTFTPWSDWEIETDCFHNNTAIFVRRRIGVDLNQCEDEDIIQEERMSSHCDFCEDTSNIICRLGEGVQLNITNLDVSIQNESKIVKVNERIIINLTSEKSLDNVSIILNHPDDEIAYIIINNLSLDDSTKRVYLEIKNESSNAVCIRDENNLNDYTEILNTCFSLSCPGNKDQYSCEVINSSTFLVSGLNHSGIVEQYVESSGSIPDNNVVRNNRRSTSSGIYIPNNNTVINSSSENLEEPQKYQLEFPKKDEHIIIDEDLDTGDTNYTESQGEDLSNNSSHFILIYMILGVLSLLCVVLFSKFILYKSNMLKIKKLIDEGEIHLSNNELKRATEIYSDIRNNYNSKFHGPYRQNILDFYDKLFILQLIKTGLLYYNNGDFETARVILNQIEKKYDSINHQPFLHLYQDLINRIEKNLVAKSQF